MCFRLHHQVKWNKDDISMPQERRRRHSGTEAALHRTEEDLRNEELPVRAGCLRLETREHQDTGDNTR
jgi:hypothetical protein